MIDTGLKDKIAIVTGANNPYGIGAGIAKALVAQGAIVFLHYYRCGEEGQLPVHDKDIPGETFYNTQRAKTPSEVLKAIRQIGGQAEAWEADLSIPDNISNLFDQAETTFGQVDILVNNAAHWEADTFLPSADILVNKTVEAWTSAPDYITASSCDRVFAVNTRAVALAMAEFVRRQINRNGNWGRIINISTDGAYCFPSEISYGASKLAMEGYTRSAAQEFGQFGITVNTISPGAIQTGWLTPEMETEIAATYPMRRVGQPDDIADAVVYFASEQARWITGQRIYVGGGHAM
ncbi:MAG: SDR family oxidoreductase [Anaerolineales bacterium]|nr:SDR family oxidoreductase [Anaerolineales bacterium]